MHSTRLIAFLIVFASVSASFAAEWREYGPPGGTVFSIVGNVSDTVHYAVCSLDAYRSFDSGQNWSPLAPLPTQGASFQDGVVVGSVTETLLVTQVTGGVLRWDASAEVWVPSNVGIDPPQAPYALQCFDLAIASPTSERVFLGCSTGLYYSDDDGKNWNKIPYPNPSYFPNRVIPSTDGSVYIYTYTPIRIEANFTDSTFFVAKPGLPAHALDNASIWPNPDHPDELLLIFPHYPAYGQSSYYFSADRGENWTPALAGSPPPQPQSALWQTGSPLVLAATGIYNLETDTLAWGERWTFPIRSQLSLYPLPQEGGWLRGSTDRGIWRTDDDGAHWTYSSQGMGGHGFVGGIAVHPGNPDILWVGFQTSGIWKTQDDGKTWFESFQGIEPDPAYGISIRSLAIDPQNPDHLLAGTEVTGGLEYKVWRSLDGGDHWTRVATAPTFLVDNILFAKSSPGTVLLGTLGGGVWRSTDGGASFESNPAFPQYSNITDIAEETGGRLFACQTATFNTQGGVFISDTFGQTWTVDETQGGFLSMAADSGAAGHVMGGYSGGGLKVTLNNGSSWTAINNGLPTAYGGYPDATHLLSDPNDSGTYYLGLRDFGIYRTLNEGNEWTPMNPTKREVESVEGPMAWSSRNSGTLFAGSSVRGVVYTQLEEPILDPTPTASITPSPTRTLPGTAPTPTFTPPAGFPAQATPRPTAEVEINVAVEPRTLSVSPKSPATGQTVQVGVTVYNDSRTPLSDVRLTCYWSLDGGAPTPFANFTLPSLRAQNWLEVPLAGSFTPNQAGTYYLQAVVDEPNNIVEDDETDNSQTASFYVRQSGSDTTPPTGSIIVAGGSPFTSNEDVGLQLSASDSGTGLGFVWVTAYYYDAWTGSLDVLYDTGWIDYLTSAFAPIFAGWTGDITTFAVNYADLDGNLSPTYWGTVTYNQLEYSEFVFYDELLYYPFFLLQGQKATITLQNLYGDPDLFVIAPDDPPGTFSWGSQNDGAASENLYITAPVEGIYWMAVFGYDFSEYRLLCSGGLKDRIDSPLGSLNNDGHREPGLDAPQQGTTPARGIEVPPIAVDFNSDGGVDALDLFYLSAQWQKPMGSAGFDARVSGLGTGMKIGASHFLRWLQLTR